MIHILITSSTKIPSSSLSDPPKNCPPMPCFFSSFRATNKGTCEINDTADANGTPPS